MMQEFSLTLFAVYTSYNGYGEIDLEDINKKIKFCFYYSTTISDIYVVCNSN